MKKAISADFPFESKFIEINGVKMHYIDENNANIPNQTTFVCIHGNPTSSYLWRNIIPYLKTKGRVIAFDLIGFGKSDKPTLDYSLATHATYVDAFINSLKLHHIVFVIHDWGLALGMSYARRNEDKIKGLVFMEGILKPMKWKDFAYEPIRTVFRLFRTPVIGKFMNVNLNMFVQTVLLKLGSNRNLTKEEKAYYNKPFQHKKDRIPVYLFPKFLPLNGKPKDAYKLANENHKWLQKTKLPKLLFWVNPGILIKPKAVEEVKKSYPNLTDILLGEATHFIQEDYPHEIGENIIKWYQTLTT